MYIKKNKKKILIKGQEVIKIKDNQIKKKKRLYKQ